MRRALIIGGSILGVIVLIVVALFGYAALNLNSIIASNREFILAKVSGALGRPVAVTDIKATLGWGVSLDLKGLTLADDPAFSSQPMVSAQDVLCRVELIPLLSKHIKVVSLDIRSPEVRVIRNRAGDLNVATIGKARTPHKAPPAQAAPPPKAAQPGAPMQLAAGAPQSGVAALAAFSISSFSIDNGTIVYQDPAWGPNPVTIRKLDLEVDNFEMNTPFDLKLALAAAGERQNFKVAGRVGPLMRADGLDIQAFPLALAIDLGPIRTADLKSIKPLAKALPEKLSIDGPVSAAAKISGTVDALKFDFKADLRSNHVVYAGSLDKPAGVALAMAASGSRRYGKLEVTDANLTLADVHLKATNLVMQGGRIAARLDSNRFDLGKLGQTVAVLQQEKMSGQAELHAKLAIAESKPSLDGTLTLANVALSPGGKMPGLSGLNGDLKMKGNSADIGPLNFVLGSGPAQLTVHARSLQPLEASYDFSAGQMKTAGLVPSRPPDEVLNNLKLTGTAAGTPSNLTVTANLTSPAGNVNNVVYRNLDLSAQYGGKRVVVKSLKLGAFGGTIGATAQAEFAATPRFNVTANLKDVDLQQALASQKSKAADIIRGILTGEVKAAGAGSDFEQIKPTLAGGGRLAVHNGKLIGVNVVASALKKIDNVPGIGSLLPMSVVARHPELFKNPDTDIDQADLSFVLEGPKITTHDLTVKAVDYSMLGDGWFDLDKRIDMGARILLSQQFSSELRADKQNVVYLQNKNQQVEIPLRITGELPKPRITPDVGDIAQRAASQAAQQKGKQLLGKFLGKKGGALGGLLGGGSSGDGSTGDGSSGGAQPQATPAKPSNPFAPFKKLF
jgi:AsmA-like C-terminal region/AsmA family